MPEIPEALLIGLGILAALAVYILAWRATRNSAFGTKALIRGGLLVLIAVPFAAGLVLMPTYERAAKSVDTQLSSPSPEAKMREEVARELEMARQGAEARSRASHDRKRMERMRRQLDAEGGGASKKMASPPRSGATRGGDTLAESAPPPAAANGGIGGAVAPAKPPLDHDFEAPQPDAMATAPPAPMAPAAPGASDFSAGAPAPPAASRSVAPDMAPEADGVAAANGGTESAAPEVAAAAEEKEAWQVVPVFFGTDREQQPNPDRLAYGSDRGRRLELGRALVTVPKSHDVPQIERPWALRVPYFDITIYEEDEDPEKHFTIEEIKALTKDQFLALARERLAASSRFKDHAIVFVHGYNTAFDHAVYRTAQISYDLKFDGAAFLYSWPSGGSVASYTYDRESASAAQPYLRQFLDIVIKDTGAKTISVIAHSMGNQPLLEVLKDMKQAAPDDVVISQVILAAPDVDADSFTNMARRIQGLAKGVTLYAASNDRAMIASRNFWQNPRAGDVPASGPIIVPGVDTVDVTAASTDTFAINHSGYAVKNELLKDIAELIQSGLRPPDQRFLKPERVTTENGAYWRYIAPPPASSGAP